MLSNTICVIQFMYTCTKYYLEINHYIKLI